MSHNQNLVTKTDLEETKTEIIAYIDKRFEGIPSKEDAKNFTTKQDLKNFPTKDDPKGFATKDDLKEELKAFATKKEMDILARHVAKLDNRMNNIEQDLQETKQNTRIMLGMLDNAVKDYDDFRTERAAIAHALKRHDNMLDNHESRISNLE